MSNDTHNHSPQVLHWSVGLGQAIKSARRRRTLTQRQLAQQANISLPTLVRMEKGDPGIAFGKMLEVMGVLDPQWAQDLLSAVLSDTLGVQLSTSNLPQRVRRGNDDF